MNVKQQNLIKGPFLMVRFWPKLMVRLWPNFGDNKNKIGPGSNHQSVNFLSPPKNLLPPACGFKRIQRTGPKPNHQNGKNWARTQPHNIHRIWIQKIYTSLSLSLSLYPSPSLSLPLSDSISLSLPLSPSPSLSLRLSLWDWLSLSLSLLFPLALSASVSRNFQDFAILKWNLAPFCSWFFVFFVIAAWFLQGHDLDRKRAG